MNEELCLEENSEEEFIKTNRVYKIANKLTKEKLKEEFEILYDLYLKLDDSYNEYKINFINLQNKTLRNMLFKTEDIKKFSKKEISRFLKEFRRELDGK